MPTSQKLNKIIVFRKLSNFMLLSILCNFLILYLILDLEFNVGELEITIFNKIVIDPVFLLIAPVLFFLYSTIKIDFSSMTQFNIIIRNFFSLIYKFITMPIIIINGAIFQSIVKYLKGKAILFNHFNIKVEIVTSKEKFLEICTDRYALLHSKHKYIPDFKLAPENLDLWYANWQLLDNDRYIKLYNYLDPKLVNYHYQKTTSMLGKFLDNISFYIDNSSVLSFLANQKYIFLAFTCFGLAFRVYSGLGLPGLDTILKFFNLNDTLPESNNKAIQSILVTQATLANELMRNNAFFREQLATLPQFLTEQGLLNTATLATLASQNYENGTMMYLIKRLFEVSTILAYSSSSGIQLSQDDQVGLLLFLKTIMQTVFIDRNQGDPIAFLDQNQGNIPVLCRALDNLYDQFLAINAANGHQVNQDLFNPKR